MRTLELDTHIKMFHETIKEKYPNLTERQVEDLCKFPFRFIKTQMERDDTPIIMVKQFGKFRITVDRVNKMIDSNAKNLKYNHITQEEHDARLVTMKDKIDRINIDNIKPENSDKILEILDDDV